MTDTPKEGETVVASKNDATPTVPPQPTVDPAVEELRKKAEQAEMRANQLANQLKAKEEAEAAAEAKRLAEQNEYKTLYEQEQAKREEIQRQIEEADRQKQIEQAQNELYGQFSSDVVELAKETGLTLTDATEEAKQALQAKLTKLSEKVSSTATPTASNPAVPAPENRAALLERMKYGDRQAREQVIATIPAVQEMRRQAGIQ